MSCFPIVAIDNEVKSVVVLLKRHHINTSQGVADAIVCILQHTISIRSSKGGFLNEQTLTYQNERLPEQVGSKQAGCFCSE